MTLQFQDISTVNSVSGVPENIPLGDIGLRGRQKRSGTIGQHEKHLHRKPVEKAQYLHIHTDTNHPSSASYPSLVNWLGKFDRYEATFSDPTTALSAHANFKGWPNMGHAPEQLLEILLSNISFNHDAIRIRSLL